ncbi:helix-turn-helix domain-containing protein [Ancylomarina sp. DW003]|nr:helix-turn-helix domain-containing protein [Ancylomarina sp. DW003]MDE5422914.1 helix-turn-helix domain-containing protein [Ancylomarina sp. DW003]
MLNQNTLTFGEYIRKLRINKGYSQEKLAELTDIHPNHIGLIERGERQPKIDTIEKLAVSLDTGFEGYFRKQSSIRKQSSLPLLNIKGDLWVFKTVSEGRAYEGNDGYADKIDEYYVYDTTVPNHKNVKEKDWIVLINKKEILGFAKIKKINSSNVLKSRYRCPECGNTQVERRKTKTPPYRCNKGHEFENRDSEEIEVDQFTAYYEGFYHVRGESNSSLRDYYIKGYNRNMSIQKLNFDFISTQFPSVASQLQAVPIKYPENTAFVSAKDDKLGYVDNGEDERNKVLRQIAERKGQAAFRRDLRRRYGDCCMVTGCKLVEVLEAAHIAPYRGEKDNHPENGLLLRSDIHTLFDLDLLGIDPEKLIIRIKPQAAIGEYLKLQGIPLKLPAKSKGPSRESLATRWKQYLNKKAED